MSNVSDLEELSFVKELHLKYVILFSFVGVDRVVFYLCVLMTSFFPPIVQDS